MSLFFKFPDFSHIEQLYATKKSSYLIPGLLLIPSLTQKPTKISLFSEFPVFLVSQITLTKLMQLKKRLTNPRITANPQNTHTGRLNLANAKLLGHRTNFADIQQRILELLGGGHKDGRLLGHLELELVALVHLKMGLGRRIRGAGKESAEVEGRVRGGGGARTGGPRARR